MTAHMKPCQPHIIHEVTRSELDLLNNGFMEWQVDWLAGDDCPTDEDTGEPMDDGYYSRLSAPGYLDCTDWTGPYDSADEAGAELVSMFGE